MNRQIPGNRYESGFTLMEIMVVCGIIVILVAAGIPALSVWYPNYQLKSAVQDLYSNLQLTKMEAVKARTDKSLTFDPTNNTYTLSNGLTIIRLSDYGSSIEFDKGDATDTIPSGGSWGVDYVTFDGNKVTFNSRGMGETDGYACLTNSKGTAYAVGSLLSGAVVLKKWNGTQWE